MKRLMLLLVGLGPLAGCAAVNPSDGCVVGPTTFVAGPSTGTANHLATPPGNQVQFTAVPSTEYSGSCAEPALAIVPDAAWKSSDTINVSVNSDPGATNGLATCLGATTGAATLTATQTVNGVVFTSSVQLTCK